jgi:endonuclease/exonuclease/phosphatase family metal-dependent hydrolase
LTYNIHHSQGVDSVSDLGRIAGVINAADPDLVALQELDQGNARSGIELFQLNQLAAMTGMQGYFGKTINFSGGEYGNGILVAPDITIASVVNHPLPNPANTEARAVIEARLSFAGDFATQQFSFLATHFDNASGTNRIAQAGYVNSLIAGSTKPAILAGDFNANPSGTTIQNLMTQWSDTTDLADSGRPRSSQIDFIFDRTISQWTVVSRGRFIINATTSVASDHYPLLSVLKLNEPVPEPSTAILVAAVGICALLGWRSEHMALTLFRSVPRGRAPAYTGGHG